MPVIMFLPRFHAPILAGTKRQTIRAARKRPVRPGDVLSLRAWSGAPYRSPQRVLREAVCTAVEPVAIEFVRGPWEATPRHLRIELSGLRLNASGVRAFALADGFAGLSDFRRHWEEHRTSPFEGILIRWEVSP